MTHAMFGLLARGGGFWMPPPESTYAGAVDIPFRFVLWMSIFFFLLITVLVVTFAWKFRERGDRGEPGRGPTHHTALEMTWTVIPLVLVLITFYFGFNGFLNMVVPPEDSYDITVHAQQWKWQFEYPNGLTGYPTLIIPAGEPVRFVLESSDVIHSLYIPAFRLKRDAVPGRYNKSWVQAKWDPERIERWTPQVLKEAKDFRPLRANIYPLYCAEYCGTKHSKMTSRVVVVPRERFLPLIERIRKQVSNLSPAEQGARLVENNCLTCHSRDGSRRIGPTYKNLFGSMQPIKGRSAPIKVDSGYVRESIIDPNAKIVAGYTSPSQMTSFQGQFEDEQIDAIIAYLKTLSDEYHGDELSGGREKEPKP